jgi:hypothetical protein
MKRLLKVLKPSSFVSNSLINMYAEHGAVMHVESVLLDALIKCGLLDCHDSSRCKLWARSEGMCYCHCN